MATTRFTQRRTLIRAPPLSSMSAQGLKGAYWPWLAVGLSSLTQLREGRSSGRYTYIWTLGLFRRVQAILFGEVSFLDALTLPPIRYICTLV